MWEASLRQDYIPLENGICHLPRIPHRIKKYPTFWCQALHPVSLMMAYGEPKRQLLSAPTIRFGLWYVSASSDNNFVVYALWFVLTYLCSVLLCVARRNATRSSSAGGYNRVIKASTYLNWLQDPVVCVVVHQFLATGRRLRPSIVVQRSILQRGIRLYDAFLLHTIITSGTDNIAL